MNRAQLVWHLMGSKPPAARPDQIERGNSDYLCFLDTTLCSYTFMDVILLKLRRTHYNIDYHLCVYVCVCVHIMR